MRYNPWLLLTLRGKTGEPMEKSSCPVKAQRNTLKAAMVLR